MSSQSCGMRELMTREHDSLALCHLYKVRVTVTYKGQVGEQNEVVWVKTTMRLNVYTPFSQKSLLVPIGKFSFRIARYSDFFIEKPEIEDFYLRSFNLNVHR